MEMLPVARQLVDLMAMKPLGMLKEVAETLGAHPSTVGRDLEAEGWTARARGRQPWTGGILLHGRERGWISLGCGWES